ncbi:MAG: class I SAM-dependent methyltransferase [Limisphaerales bacterium]
MGERPCATTLKPEMTAEELAGLESWIRDAELTGNHLEIGTAAGGTLCFLMTRYAEDARPHFSVVDTMSYFRDQLDTVKRNLVDHGLDPARVDFRVSNSDDAFTAAAARKDRFDFMLVDASHKIRYVMRDLRWLRLLAAGGIACFHDYAPAFKGVRWPIDRFLRRNPHFEKVGLAGSLLCVRKTSESSGSEVTALDRLWASLCSPLLQWELSWRKRLNRRSNAD